MWLTRTGMALCLAATVGIHKGLPLRKSRQPHEILLSHIFLRAQHCSVRSYLQLTYIAVIVISLCSPPIYRKEFSESRAMPNNTTSND